MRKCTPHRNGQAGWKNSNGVTSTRHPTIRPWAIRSLISNGFPHTRPVPLVGRGRGSNPCAGAVKPASTLADLLFFSVSPGRGWPGNLSPRPGFPVSPLRKRCLPWSHPSLRLCGLPAVSRPCTGPANVARCSLRLPLRIAAPAVLACVGRAVLVLVCSVVEGTETSDDPR